MSATVPCMSRFTTVKGEHWCSVEVGADHAFSAYGKGVQIAHEGPCVEITERWGAVENTIWAAMKSNAHLIRPKAHEQSAVVKSTSTTGRVSAVAVPGDWRMHTVKHTQKCRDDNRVAACAGGCQAPAPIVVTTKEDTGPVEGQVWECRDQVGRTGEQVRILAAPELAPDEDLTTAFIVSKAAKGYEAELGAGGSMETAEFAQRYRLLPGITA